MEIKIRKMLRKKQMVMRIMEKMKIVIEEVTMMKMEFQKGKMKIQKLMGIKKKV